jgi:predicted adenine nucleotide alpha hydrolase (AANH) superfamily ATPase
VFWYNPNIHPYKEYEQRMNTLKEYAKLVNVNAIFEDEYGLQEFCKNVVGNLGSRCSDYCYRIRLEKTAKYAKEARI